MHLLRAFLCCFALSATVHAQSLPSLESAEPKAALLFARTGGTGLIVVVVRDGDVWFRSYGQTFPGSHQPPAPDSLLRLCSITKIMTTDLFVRLALEHKVALTDPLQRFAPEGIIVPTRTVHGPNSRVVTLGDLATHTAGIPREIAYPANGEAHFTFPDFAFRWQWLATSSLRTVPGTAAHYSNPSFDYLADALAKAAGEPYEQLFAERTSRPLGLHETTLTPTADQCTRLLRGRKGQGDCTSTVASAGSGGMYSTARDMAVWMKYLLGLPGVSTHAPAEDLATYLLPEQLHSIQGLQHAGVPTGIGLGWVRIGGTGEPQTIVEKTGGGAGFQTYIALNQASHTGIFVAETDGVRSGANLFRETNDLLLYLSGLPPLPLDVNDPERERAADEAVEKPTRAVVHKRTAKAHRKTR